MKSRSIKANPGAIALLGSLFLVLGACRKQELTKDNNVNGAPPPTTTTQVAGVEPSPFKKSDNSPVDDSLLSYLSEARSNIGSAYYRGKLYYAGGIGQDYSKALDILDLENYRTTRMNLSEPRLDIVAVPCSNLVLFAGGIAPRNANQMEAKDVVDIYHPGSGNLTTAKLSLARTSITAAASDSNAYFAGGDDGYGTGALYSRVDIFHAKSGTWTTAELSAKRIGIGAIAVNGKAIFAGGLDESRGPSDVVDIYDEATGNWTSSRMPFKKVFGKTLMYKQKVLFFDAHGGPITMLDPVSMNWSILDVRTASLYVAGEAILRDYLFEIGIYKATPSLYALLTDLPGGRSDTLLLNYDLNYASVETDGQYIYLAGGQSEYRTNAPYNRGIYRLRLP